MIHFVHLHSSPGGIEVLLPRIIEQLPEKVIQSFVVRPQLPGQSNVYENKNVNLIYGSSNNRIALWKLWNYARRHKEEIFHVYNIGPFNLLVLRLAGIKRLIYSIHGTKYWKSNWQKWLRKPVWKLALSKSFRIIANSKFSRDCFIQAIGYRGKADVLYNPFSNQIFHPAMNPKNNQLTITYCGRLAHGKNLFKWIDIAKYLNEQYPDIRFEIYGNGPLKTKLEARIKQLDLQAVVKLMGHNSNIAKVYQTTDVFLFLSEYESFGNVAVECILCGTPVIVSDIPSMKEIFCNYPEFIVPLDDQLNENVSKKIKELPELKKSALLAAKEFEKRFSEHQHLETLKMIYENV